MESRESKLLKAIGLLALLLMTFGITYIDCEDLSLENNIRPYLEILLGIFTGVYLFYLKRKHKDDLK
jgi:hypothetical protein